MSVQELQFHTEKGGFIESDIERTANGFSATRAIVRYSATNPEPTPTAIPFNQNYPTAQGAFQELFNKLKEQLEEYDPENRIVKLNNPCNCEFISHIEQQEIVGDKIEVSLNG